MVKLLISRGIRGYCARIKGMGPVHLAAQKNFCGILKILLESGYDADEKDDNGDPPLFLATKYNKFEAVKTLIDHGAAMENFAGIVNQVL